METVEHMVLIDVLFEVLLDCSLVPFRIGIVLFFLQKIPKKLLFKVIEDSQRGSEPLMPSSLRKTSDCVLTVS